MLGFILLFTVISPVSCKIDTFQRLEVPFTGKNVTRLSNNFGISNIQCAASCTERPCCLAYAYETMNDECVLMDQTWNNRSSQDILTTDEQWFYYEKEVKGNCPSDWNYFLGFCFKLHINSKDWYQAQETCRQSNSFLAEIYCSRLGDITQSVVINKVVHEIWLGGTDMQEEGIWKWSHGNKDFNYRNWNASQPDNYHNSEDCLVFSKSWNFKWNDDNCNFLYPFICQKDAI